MKGLERRGFVGIREANGRPSGGSMYVARPRVLVRHVVLTEQSLKGIDRLMLSLTCDIFSVLRLIRVYSLATPNVLLFLKCSSQLPLFIIVR